MFINAFHQMSNSCSASDMQDIYELDLCVERSNEGQHFIQQQVKYTYNNLLKD